MKIGGHKVQLESGDVLSFDLNKGTITIARGSSMMYFKNQAYVHKFSTSREVSHNRALANAMAIMVAEVTDLDIYAARVDASNQFLVTLR
jgi:hypothetical protein